MTKRPAPDWLHTVRRVMGKTPYLAGLGGDVVDVGDARARLRVPYSNLLVGNLETGVVHGGVISAMLDEASGVAVMAALDAPLPIATLDLRIDYMGPAKPGEAILADAHCFRVAREIAFVRGVAHHGNVEEPIAVSTGAFMLMRNAPSRP